MKKKRTGEKEEIRSRKKLTNCEILLSTSLVLFPCETTVSRFLLRCPIIHRFDFVWLVRIAGFREIREKRENCLGDALILSGIIPGKESSSSHQWQPEDIRYILATNAAQTLKQNYFVRWWHVRGTFETRGKCC